MHTFNHLGHFILATLLFGLPACSSTTSDTPPDEQDAHICTDPALADFDKVEYQFSYATSLVPWLESGNIYNYDPDLRFFAFGEHAGASEGPDHEPIGGLTLFYSDEPDSSALAEDGRDACTSTIASATLSTTDVRIGTAEEANGKLYQLAEVPDQGESCFEPQVAFNGRHVRLPPNNIEFFYVSSDRAWGWFCAYIQQVSPDSGEPFLLVGDFAIGN